MNQTIRKSILSMTLFFAMGLSATACGPEEGFENSEQSESTASVEQAVAPYQNFRSGVTNFWGTNFCLKVKDAVVADGTPAQIYQCNQNGTAQQWYYDPITLELRSALTSSYCLDVSGGVVADGTPVQLYLCNGTDAQKWTRTTTNEFRTQLDPSYCLDVKGGVAANGTPVQIHTCNSTKAQKWFVL